MSHIYILTYIDAAAFDDVLHMSAHTSRELAERYAQDVVFPDLAIDVGKDWAYALAYDIKKMRIVA